MEKRGGLSVDDRSPFGDLSFLATASHELKAPLALVRQLALSLGNEHDEAIRLQTIDRIVLTSEKALRLTSDLSRSARLQDSLFELEPVNPQQLCEEVAHELSPLYAAHGREIRVSSHRRRMLAVANRDLLRRILINFGDNALHYADPHLPVELRTGLHGEKVRIGVRDYGPALSANVWRRLQQRLGTGNQVLHNRPQSSGLGLYVAGQFASVMRGDIGAVRHRDGATFFVDMAASTQLRLL
jgi:K+-sensing histidine kinase KdpD